MVVSITRRQRLAVAVISLLILAMSLSLVTPSQTAFAAGSSTVTLNPNQGPAGTVVTGSGINWTVNDLIQISWAETGSVLNTTRVQPNDTFSVRFQIPTNAGQGGHNIYFTDLNSRYFLVAVFTVGAAKPVPWDCNHLAVPAVAFYDGPNFVQPEICFEGSGLANLTDYGWAKRAESINVGVHTGCFYDGTNGTGNSWCFSGSFTKSTLGIWNNRIVSFRIS